MNEARVQQLAGAAGVDWKIVWEALKKLSPLLQSILLGLLEQGQDGSVPNISLSDDQQPTIATVQPVAAGFGLSVDQLMALLKVAGPLLGQIILKLLSRQDIADNAGGPG